ncbi:hypothetical protein [Sulfurisphaera ohwakuensis]|uniref:Uncharacterized protein YcfJ n=1 Tax=Sulfurisphaera ohwakuensis TaxID=69656 RepID=A0A650CIL5_SULOH|nr:hypothetical protein [Sulfurisphaera ohwakuensis]MBB5255217.1 uncharacterized protein YcfJ [Sulfurisphaera ohwakuensis]QGR17619.1 hypothetical protein D1869_10775 [Sulfurisphaera ohwakuensis]
MVDYIARYVLRDREVIVKYTAENDDESIKLANSVCEKLGERDIEEVIISKIVGTITGATIGHSISEDNSVTTNILSTITGALIGHIIDNLIVKEIYSKKYPCIRPRQLSDLHKYIDIKKLEDAVNAR